VRGLLGKDGLTARLSTFVALAGAIGVLLIAAAVVFDILMRWLFNSPILAVDDLNPFNIAVVVAAFFPLCLIGRHFVTIRFLGRAMGDKAHLFLEFVGAVATLFVFILYAWQLLRYAAKLTANGLASGVLEIPQAPWWWVVAIILVFSVLVQLAVVAETIVAWRKGEMPVLEGSADTGA